MSRILVLGGYGGFGGRIARRLAAARHEIMVAGRSVANARSFCAGDVRLTPVEVTRDTIVAALAEHRPAILVDASGPFQTMDHAVPAACIAAGAHYVDIADRRGFACGIHKLDRAAQAARVTVLAGASSVPALSGAVVRHLAEGVNEVRAVEMAISASNRVAAGPAVTAAILAQVGQRIRLWRGRRWQDGAGWQEIRRETFVVAGVAPVADRLVALVDVPDLALLPDRLPGGPTVTFRAGTELSIQNIALWLGSWLVRWGWMRNLAPLARPLQVLQKLSSRLGSDRSAMVVRLFGLVDGRRVERRWTLIADEGDGPEIPALSVPLLVDRILSAQEMPGARDAGQSLTLASFQPAFDGLAIRHGTTEDELPPPLYARVMGERFAALPAAVRAMHDVLRDGAARGCADVTGPANTFAALIARLFGFPPTGSYDLQVSFTERDGVETWTRDFGGCRFRSRLSQCACWLVEGFGPLRFAFDLLSDAHGLTMVMRRWWLGAIPLPLLLAPRSVAREWHEDGSFQFDVLIALPLIGRLVHYRGWLKRE